MKPFVDFSRYNSNNPFGARDTIYYPSTHHHIGSDFKVPVGTLIQAPCDGEIVKTVFNRARGNTAIFYFVWEGQTWGLELCHLRELHGLGTFKQGEVIAHTGNTGTATTAPHLHVVMHKDCLVTKNYQDLISEEAFYKLIAEGRLTDPYKWFLNKIGSVKP